MTTNNKTLIQRLAFGQKNMVIILGVNLIINHRKRKFQLQPQNI